MPGEFEPHAGCWMLWPCRSDNWRLGGKPAQQAFVEVAKAFFPDGREPGFVNAVLDHMAREARPAEFA